MTYIRWLFYIFEDILGHIVHFCLRHLASSVQSDSSKKNSRLSIVRNIDVSLIGHSNAFTERSTRYSFGLQLVQSTFKGFSIKSENTVTVPRKVVEL